LYLQPEHIDALLQGTDLLLRIATPGASNVEQADVDAYVARMNTLLKQGTGMLRGATLLPAATESTADSALLASALLLADAALSGAAIQSNANSPVQPAPEAAMAEPQTRALPRRNRRASEGGERVLRVTAERLNGLLDMSSKSLVETQRLKPFLTNMQRLKRLQGSSQRALDDLEAGFGETGMAPEAQKALHEARRMLAEAQQMLIQQTAELDEFG